MGEPKRDAESPRRDEVKSLKVRSKRGVLAAVIPADDPLGKDRCLDELSGLAKTAGVDVVGELIQVRDKPHPGHCLGTGKLDELKLLAKSADAEVIIFDNALSPSQGKAVEEATGTVVI
ncbi:MAG: GTPase HflX, partial [Planctomycetota bacterium]